jgi:RimJ/RimL family protein N-acetyltransferase
MSPELMRAVVARDWPAAGRLLGATFPEEWRSDAWAWLPKWLESVQRDPALVPWGPHLLLAEVGGERTVVGEAGFHGRPDAAGVAEFGYMTVSTHRRRGYAEEAVRALFRWAESEPGVRTFRATVHPDNGASIALLRKLEFAETGRQRHPERGPELIFERNAATGADSAYQPSS